MAVLSKTGITNSSIIQASHITQSIDALTGQVTDYDITISGSLTLTGSFRIANGTITSSGAISSSAGLFGTTLVTSGAITSSGAISSSAGLFGTTLVTSGAITSSGAISSSAGLFGTTLVTSGSITSSGAISSSAGLFGTNVTATGNVAIGGTLTTTGAITSSGAISSSAGLFGTTLRTTGAITSSGAISSSAGLFGTALTTSNITATSIAATDLVLNKTGSQTNGQAQLYLNGPTLNRIDFNTQGVGSPIINATSTGSKIVLYPAAGAITTDYAIGIEPSTLWFSIPSNTHAVTYNFYGGASSVMRLRGDSILTLATHSSWPPSPNPPSGSLAISGSGTAMRLMLWNGGGWVAQA